MPDIAFPIGLYIFLAFSAICFYSDKISLKREVASLEAEKRLDYARKSGYHDGKDAALSDVQHGLYDPVLRGSLELSKELAEIKYKTEYHAY